MKEKILHEMEDYFGDDAKRIDHARRVLNYAQQIFKEEKGDGEIVEAAAILHDIGIHAAEKKYNSTAGKYQQIEGPPIASDILNKINFPKDKISEVLEIIAHHHSGGIDTPSFRIIWDADWLVNIKDEIGLEDKEKLGKVINKAFLTLTGKALAQRTYLIG